MSEPAFLEEYGGQSVRQLIALRSEYRLDSLVLAVEQALYTRPRMGLSDPERVVLAVEGLEREVNNGGYEQFFKNSSCEFTSHVVRALSLIGCPAAASITADAIGILGLSADSDSRAVELAAGQLSDGARRRLDGCDARYFELGEDIAGRLFEYIERHATEIRIP